MKARVDCDEQLHEDQSAYEVRLVDMNGDGAPDILMAAQESQNVVWFETDSPRVASQTAGS